MRIFALSDLHVDYSANKQWVANLSTSDYRDDVLIVAGDISDFVPLLVWCMSALAARFSKVLYVPGNHDLWVYRDGSQQTSLDKFRQLQEVIGNCGGSMQPFHCNDLSVIPLLSWYDYSFGEPTAELISMWMDYYACRWPGHYSMPDVAEYFHKLNTPALDIVNRTVISFSHFLPRIDLMPSYIPQKRRILYPILGSSKLEEQIRQLHPAFHIYGHSHVNRNVAIDGISYINNAFGYPQEISITAKSLMCIYEG